jgi:hypothetical protein
MNYEERLQLIALKLWPIRSACAQKQLKEKTIQDYHLKRLLQEYQEQVDKRTWLDEKERTANIQ